MEMLNLLLDKNTEVEVKAIHLALNTFMMGTGLNAKSKFIRYLAARYKKDKGHVVDLIHELYNIDLDADNIEEVLKGAAFPTAFNNEVIYNLYTKHILNFWVRAFLGGFLARVFGRGGNIQTGSTSINKAIRNGLVEYFRDNIDNPNLGKFFGLPIHNLLSSKVQQTFDSEVKEILDNIPTANESADWLFPKDSQVLEEGIMMDFLKKNWRRSRNWFARKLGNETATIKLFTVADRLGLDWHILQVLLNDTKITKQLRDALNRKGSTGYPIIARAITNVILRQAIGKLTNLTALTNVYGSKELAVIMNRTMGKIIASDDVVQNVAIEIQDAVYEALNTKK